MSYLVPLSRTSSSFCFDSYQWKLHRFCFVGSQQLEYSLPNFWCLTFSYDLRCSSNAFYWKFLPTRTNTACTSCLNNHHFATYFQKWPFTLFVYLLTQKHIRVQRTDGHYETNHTHEVFTTCSCWFLHWLLFPNRVVISNSSRICYCIQLKLFIIL